MPTSRVARAFLLLSDLFLCFTCDGSLDLLSSTEGEIRRIPCLVVLIGLIIDGSFHFADRPHALGRMC